MRSSALTLAALMAVACQAETDRAPDSVGDNAGGPGDVSAKPPAPEDNGQTGSIGGQAICVPERCAEVAASIVSEIALRGEPDVELRHHECRTGQCLVVLRKGEACYATETANVLRDPYSCALSDAEILERYAASFAPPPPAACPGGVAALPIGGGTLVMPGQPLAFDIAQGEPPRVGICAVNPEPEVCVERDPAEWQGLRVCSPYTPCDSSAFCGLARACIDAWCQACRRDEDCASGEGCALDHCVRLTQLECRSARDCAAGELCYLSGYTGGTPRANEDMYAYCAGTGGPNPRYGR